MGIDITKITPAVRDRIHVALLAQDAASKRARTANAAPMMPVGSFLAVSRPSSGGFAQLGRIYVVAGTPVAKPRMTQRDKWQKRDCVLRYRAYCDRLRAVVGTGNPNTGEIHVVIHLAGEAALIGSPCRKHSDADNYLKAVVDALFKQDKSIWKMSVEKRWTREGDERTEIVMR